MSNGKSLVFSNSQITLCYYLKAEVQKPGNSSLRVTNLTLQSFLFLVLLIE